MTQFEKIKEEISNIDNPMEFVGYMDGLRTAAGLFCKEKYPDEVIFENGKLDEVTIYGMCHYLESKV